ncbi:MAG: hypothetical protein E3K32_12525 [wastewater metagenome]|nr:hypothetical protein [Candidatus Loosdrechtia aerotolerans]
MSERTAVLQRLQSIDTKIKQLEGDKLYRSYDVQKKRDQVQQKKEKLQKLGEDIKNSQKNITSRELDLKSKESEIHKLQTQLNLVKTNKEYSAIKTEIAGKEADKSIMEDDILRLIDIYEEAQQRYTTYQKEIEGEESQLQELRRHVEADLKTIDAEVQELKKKRNEYTALLDHDTLQHYNRLVNHRDSVAVVSVVNKVCQGCFMSVTSQTVNQLLSNKELTFCHSCGRILYLDSHNEEQE